MAFRCLKVVTTLILINIGFCFAILNGRDIKTDERGIKIVSAKCVDKEYSVEELYQGVARGMEILRNEIINIEAMQYIASPGDDFPFSPPYYHFPLHSSARAMSFGYQKDHLIFTGDGKLVTVIYTPCNRFGSSLRLEAQYYDCILVPKNSSLDMGRPRKWLEGSSHNRRRPRQ